MSNTREYALICVNDDNSFIYNIKSFYLNVMANVTNIDSIFMSHKESNGISYWAAALWFKTPQKFEKISREISGILQMIQTGNGLANFKSTAKRFVGFFQGCFVSSENFKDMVAGEIFEDPKDNQLEKIFHRLTPQLLKWIRNKVPRRHVTYIYGNDVSLDSVGGFMKKAGLIKSCGIINDDFVSKDTLQTILTSKLSVIIINVMNKPFERFKKYIEVMNLTMADDRWYVFVGILDPSIKFGIHYASLSKKIDCCEHQTLDRSKKTRRPLAKLDLNPIKTVI